MAVAPHTCSVCGSCLEGLEPSQAQEHVTGCLELLMAPTQMSEGDEDEDAACLPTEEDEWQHAQHGPGSLDHRAPTAQIECGGSVHAQTAYFIPSSSVQFQNDVCEPVCNARPVDSHRCETIVWQPPAVATHATLYEEQIMEQTRTSSSLQLQCQSCPQTGQFTSEPPCQQLQSHAAPAPAHVRCTQQQAHLQHDPQQRCLVQPCLPDVGSLHVDRSLNRQPQQHKEPWHNQQCKQQLTTPVVDVNVLAGSRCSTQGDPEAAQQLQPANAATVHGTAPSRVQNTSLHCLSCSTADWLASQGLLHLLPAFQLHEVDELAVPLLTDMDLQAMGICCPTLQARLLQAAAQHSTHQPAPLELDMLCQRLAHWASLATSQARDSGRASTGHSPQGTHVSSPQQQQEQQVLSAGPDVCQLQHKPKHEQDNVKNQHQSGVMHHMFKAQPAVVPRITAFLHAGDGKGQVAAVGTARLALAAAAAHAIRTQLQAQAKQHKGTRHAAHNAAALGRGQARTEVTRTDGQAITLKGLPRWHTLPGTRFTVDYFCPAGAKVQGSNGVWILTHFHADHYKGLSSKWDRGRVLCSPVTAQLINTRLKVPVNRIQELAIGVTCEVEGVPLQMVDANHCPGAVMVIAHPHGKPPVLHTGDCRLCMEMQQQPALQALRGKGAVLVLDTTYCDPQYCFPSQQEALAYTLTAVRTELFNPRALVVFGTYTIGKERLFLEVAHTLGKKVYVSKDKMAVLQCCGLTKPYLELLTTNHLETNLHAVPLHKVNLDGLGAILLSYKGRYNTITGIQPTGWAMQKQSSKGSCGRRIQKGTIILHSVPYSEHSSFKELHDFCTWLQPSVILPSVNNDNGAGTEKMLSLLRQPLATTSAAAAASSKPITAYLHAQQPPQQPKAQPPAGYATSGARFQKAADALRSSESHSLPENIPPAAVRVGEPTAAHMSPASVLLPVGQSLTSLERGKRGNAMQAVYIADAKRQKGLLQPSSC